MRADSTPPSGQLQPPNEAIGASLPLSNFTMEALGAEAWIGDKGAGGSAGGGRPLIRKYSDHQHIGIAALQSIEVRIRYQK